jgi:hypothetical protein
MRTSAERHSRRYPEAENTRFVGGHRWRLRRCLTRGVGIASGADLHAGGVALSAPPATAAQQGLTPRRAGAVDEREESS